MHIISSIFTPSQTFFCDGHYKMYLHDKSHQNIQGKDINLVLTTTDFKRNEKTHFLELFNLISIPYIKHSYQETYFEVALQCTTLQLQFYQHLTKHCIQKENVQSFFF